MLLQLHSVMLTKYVHQVTKDEQNILSFAFCTSLILWPFQISIVSSKFLGFFVVYLSPSKQILV
jgi:hypothetical protein